MTSTFDPEKGEELAVEGMGRAFRRAAAVSPTWKNEVSMVLKFLIWSRQPFTSENVWLYVDKPTDFDPRALGGIINWFSRRGYIRELETRREKAQISSRHRAPIRVWVGTPLGESVFRSFVEEE